MTASFHGWEGIETEFVFYVREFNHRQRLKTLGFTDDLNLVDAYTGEVFVEISQAISNIEKAEAEKAKDKRS